MPPARRSFGRRLPNDAVPPARPEPGPRCRRHGVHLVVAYFRSFAHCWIAAVSLGSAACRHFEYFSNWAGVGDPPEPEPPEPDPPEPEPEPPDPPDPLEPPRPG